MLFSLTFFPLLNDSYHFTDDGYFGHNVTVLPVPTVRSYSGRIQRAAFQGQSATAPSFQGSPPSSLGDRTFQLDRKKEEEKKVLGYVSIM